MHKNWTGKFGKEKNFPYSKNEGNDSNGMGTGNFYRVNCSKSKHV